MTENSNDFLDQIDYVEYVEQQITAYKDATKFVNEDVDTISPAQINKALGQYSSIQIGLIAEYKRVEQNYNRKKSRFDLWWDEKFIETRKRLNDPSLPASKWLSKGEIDSETRVANKEEYLEKYDELLELETKVSFLRNLLDSWKRHGDVLVSLSHNSRSEMKALGLDNRVNQAVRNERKIRNTR